MRTTPAAWRRWRRCALARVQTAWALANVSTSDHLGHPFAFGYFKQARRRPSFAVMRYALAHPRLLPYTVGHQTLSASCAPRPEAVHILQSSMTVTWDPCGIASYGGGRTVSACGSGNRRRDKLAMVQAIACRGGVG